MKRGLSKNLLRMKFMQRTAMEAEKEQSLADRVITSEEWRYDPALLAGLSQPPLRGVVSRPDYLPVIGPHAGALGPVLPLQPAAWGRVSFGGFNPAVEKLMAECGGGGSGVGISQAEAEAELGATVSAERMASLMMRQERMKTSRKRKADAAAADATGEHSAVADGLAKRVAEKFLTKRERKQKRLEKEAAAAADAARQAETAAVAESTPEEGELDEAEEAVDQLPPPGRLARKLKKKKLLRMKRQLQMQPDQHDAAAVKETEAEEDHHRYLHHHQHQYEQQLEQHKRLKTKKVKKSLMQSILPHPSTLVMAAATACRKRKADSID